MVMANNQNYKVMTELVEQHQKRIKYLENKVLEYEAEINQLKYFIKEEKK
jgi:cob(I)alamin adenosyltransferase